METPREHFENVLRVAQWLSDDTNSVNALLAFARMIGREFAYEYFLYQIAPDRDAGQSPLLKWRLLANEYGIPQEEGAGERIWLGWDAVIANPWNDGRLADSLSKLSGGPAGQSQRWRFDESNHKIALWLPMRLAEVWAGNHSIAAGILGNTGVVPVRAIFDLSPLYERLTQPAVGENSSGDFVFWSEDDESSGINVGDWRLGALFEIGRLLHEQGFDGRLGDAWHPGF